MLAGAATGLLFALPLPVQAEVNSVTGGIAGIDNGTLVGGDGTGEAQITLGGVTLSLVKQARDLTGTVLPNGSSVDQGQELYFVLYVDNSANFPATDIRITDLLDEAQFTYVDGSLERTDVPTGSNDAAIWAGIWTGLTDGASDDEASAGDSGGPAGRDRITIGAVPSQSNAQVDLSGQTLIAVRFRVTVN
jgi:uncharacterized repeat protein (TIGR01451 family)